MKQTKWDSSNITNQKGRVVIVTGSSSGIGFEAARVLAAKEATVIIAVRNLKKGNAAMEKIKRENPKDETKKVNSPTTPDQDKKIDHRKTRKIHNAPVHGRFPKSIIEKAVKEVISQRASH